MSHSSKVDVKILDRVAALLGRVERGPHESEASFANRQGEVENALSQANRIMKEHGLAMIDVQQGAPSLKDKSAVHTIWPMGKGAAFGTYAHQILAASCAEACYCHCLVQIKMKRFIFIGDEIEAAVAGQLYTFLIEQIAHLCKLERRKYEFEAGSASYKKFTRDYTYGMIARIGHRLQGEFAIADNDAGSMLIRLSSERNQLYAKKNFLYNPDSVNKTKTPEWNSVTENGYEKGGEINLNAPNRADL